VGRRHDADGRAALDPYGNVATAYAGTVHFSSTDSHPLLPADYTFTASEAGSHTFGTGVILQTAGRAPCLGFLLRPPLPLHHRAPACAGRPRAAAGSATTTPIPASTAAPVRVSAGLDPVVPLGGAWE
jgi:hypothetical protein